MTQLKSRRFAYLAISVWVITSFIIGYWIICVIILSSVPPVSRDALTQHLFLPKLFLKAGGIVDIPSLVVSHYPMNVDLLYTLPIYFGKDYWSKYIHFGFALLTGGLIYIYLKNRLGHLSAVFGLLLFITLPIIVKLSTTAYVDLGFVFFSFAALLSIIKWSGDGVKKKYFFISAVSCGLCLGTKYNGLIVLLLLTLLAVYLHSRNLNKRTQNNPFLMPIICGVGYISIALFVFSPWMIRNYRLTSNPVFPLFNNVFLPDAQYPPDYRDQQVLRYSIAKEALSDSAHSKGPFMIRRLAYNESWTDTLLVPLRIFFQGKDDNPQYFDGRLNPYLLFLPLLAMFVYPRKTADRRMEKHVLLAFSIFYFLIVYFKADMRVRYVAPVIPPIVILSVFGIYQSICFINERFIAVRRTICHITIFGILLVLLYPNGRYLQEQFENVAPWAYLDGRISRKEYISRYRPEYFTVDYANENLASSDKILCLFLGLRGYYFNNEVIFSEKIFKEYLTLSIDGEEFAYNLKLLNITHIMLRNDLFVQWSKTEMNQLDLKRLSSFFQHNVNLLYAKAGYTLFKIN